MLRTSYNRFVNKVSAKRQPSIIRELLKILQTASEDMIPLSGGLPNPKMFPFKNAAITLGDGRVLNIQGEAWNDALQYLPTQGHLGLIRQLESLQTHFHGIDAASYEVITTNGSQDGLCKALEMVVNPGDSVILEDHTYFACMSILDPIGTNYVIVEGDQNGMKPDHLWKSLTSNWRPGDPGVPKAIYLNPTGANPTGIVMPLARKKEIYDMCSEYNILILEDDPYYYMQFKTPREPSFLSLDKDRRVLRFDSFSKILSSGIRLGFVTGPKPLVDQMVLHLQVSSLHASALSQVLINELLQDWGIPGFENHIREIEEFYQRRRDSMHQAALKHLSGLCEWNVPEGGMFLWIKVNDVECTWNMIMDKGLKKNIMLVPGRVFKPNALNGSSYLRASYSIADEGKFDEAFRRLAELIHEEKVNI
eukprot:snap_masked-scaffold12_size759060-processed-gene-2.11 protein:Tk05565 transcript:snap_masked-scaffold12_size759060-processed-gene-2.11-mRNA-1 annotation:"kynurenine alpha-aminoadipate aminotransferase mitochondrial precursor"